MSGTRAGGIKAKNTNYLRHGEDFYKHIGKKGGQNGNTGGFAANPELARKAGAKGGKISKRRVGSKIEKNKDKIISYILQGFTLVDIAKLFDIPYSTLSQWWRRERRK